MVIALKQFSFLSLHEVCMCIISGGGGGQESSAHIWGNMVVAHKTATYARAAVPYPPTVQR